MALSFQEMREMEVLKQEHKKEILRLQNANSRNLHRWKMVEIKAEQDYLTAQLAHGDLGDPPTKEAVT